MVLFSQQKNKLKRLIIIIIIIIMIIIIIKIIFLWSFLSASGPVAIHGGQQIQRITFPSETKKKPWYLINVLPMVGSTKNPLWPFPLIYFPPH